MVRNFVAGIGVAAMLVSCVANDSSIITTTAIDTTAVSTTISVEPSSTPVLPSSTTLVPATTTTTLSYELGVWGAPADGQWFNELPIPWVYGVSTPIDEPGVPGSMGWTREEAAVTVNGYPTDSESCNNCMYQRGRLWKWRAADRPGDPYGFEPGTHTVVFEAMFTDGVVVNQSRTFHYEPTLEASTGWLVEIDHDARTMTIAFAPHGTIDPQIGPWAGFLSEATSVDTLPVASDAALILLRVDSGGEPPDSTVDFDEFVRLLDASEEGCPPSDEPWENPCFFASDAVFVSPAQEYGFPFIIYTTEEGEIQQVEQIWGE